jgi:hypothetical protein
MAAVAFHYVRLLPAAAFIGNGAEARGDRDAASNHPSHETTARRLGHPENQLGRVQIVKGSATRQNSPRASLTMLGSLAASTPGARPLFLLPAR